MLDTSGTRFESILGSGRVGADEFGVYVCWRAEGEIQAKWYRARRSGSKTTRSGSRWLFYESRPGQHNRTIHIPESCVLRALANKEAQDDNK